MSGTTRLWATALLYACGCGLLWLAAGWLCAIGAFILVWGHHAEKH